MFLKDLARIIFADGTASEDTNIKVKTHTDKRILWSGKAKDLQDWEKIAGWIVVEVLVDFEDETNPAVYNKGKIITVI